MNRYALILLAFLGFSAAPIHAQVPTQTPGGVQGTAPPPIIERQDAQQTRDELHQLLREHPTNLSVILRNDPSLANSEYLAPYPALLNFIQRHPEITRNPQYFFGNFDIREPRVQDRSLEMFEAVIGGFGVILAVGTFVGVFTWLIRFFVDHRRWLRVTRTQAEVHTKLLDRFSNNEDLVAYMQTPAGRRFLESTPIALESEPKNISAPMSRILWSMQAGVVLASLGIGFFFAQTRFPDDMSEGFYIIGMLVASLGIGFVLSAVLAYMVSARVGLFVPPRTTHD